VFSWFFHVLCLHSDVITYCVPVWLSSVTYLEYWGFWRYKGRCRISQTTFYYIIQLLQVYKISKHISSGDASPDQFLSWSQWRRERGGGGYPPALENFDCNFLRNRENLTVVFSEFRRIYVQVSSKSRVFNCSFLRNQENLTVSFSKFWEKLRYIFLCFVDI
jgi:hypothetical protein